MNVHIYIYIYVYMHTYIHTYIHTYRHARTDTLKRVSFLGEGTKQPGCSSFATSTAAYVAVM